jgi:hypothetical protein
LKKKNIQVQNIIGIDGTRLRTPFWTPICQNQDLAHKLLQSHLNSWEVY